MHSRRPVSNLSEEPDEQNGLGGIDVNIVY